MPLAFQIGVSVFLLDQLQLADMRIEQELERKRIVASLDQIEHLHVRCLAAAAFYSISRDEEVGKRHFALLKQLSAEMKHLRELTEHDPGLLELTTNLQKAILEVVPFEMLMRKLSLMESKPQVNQSQAARARIKESMHQIEEFQRRLVAAVDDIDEFRQSAQLLQAELAGAFVLLLVLTTLIISWTQKNLSEIDVLLQQIEKFKKGQAIEPLLKSRDEIAELEKIVSESANRIASLERMRRELCSIVSHDVRAPMTSIGGLITLLDAGAFCQLKPKQEELIAKLKTVSEDLLAVLNNILDIDKLRVGKFEVSLAEVKCEEIEKKVLTELESIGFKREKISMTRQGETFLCDIDAFTRAVVELARAFTSSDAKIEMELQGSAFRMSVKAQPGSEQEHEHEQKTAYSLAELFCDVQALQLSSDTAQGTTVFSMHQAAPLLHPKQEVYRDSKLKRPITKLGKRLVSLISASVAVSATAILLLGVLLSQVGQDIGRELDSREIVHRSTSIASGITHLMLLSIRRVPGELGEEEIARQKLKAGLDADVQSLQELEVKSRLQRPKELELVEQKVESVKVLSDKMVGEPVDKLGETLKKLVEKEGALSSIAFSKAGSLLAEQEQHDTTRKLKDARATILELMIGASLLVGIITLFAAIGVSKEFGARLKNVRENAERLVRNEPLKEPDRGIDEIADLDAFFFQVARQIEQLERERKQLSGLLREQLKQPLAFLRQGFTIIFNDAEDLNDKGKNRIQRTLIEIGRLSDLVDDLLILDSIEEGGGINLDVTVIDTPALEFVRQSVDAVALQAELKNIRIEYGGDHALHVKADPGRAVQIMVNLLSNAIKFSPDGSSIDVSIEAESGVSGLICFNVIDRGRGIPESEKDRVFARFDQVRKEDSAKGSGLGLFISKKLAEAQGGTLTFESTEGKGTTFRLALPAVPV